MELHEFRPPQTPVRPRAAGIGRERSLKRSGCALEIAPAEQILAGTAVAGQRLTRQQRD